MKIALILLLGVAAAAQTPAPVSPSPAAKYFIAADLMKTLAEAAKTNPALHTVPVDSSDHYRITLVERTTPTGPTAHPGFLEEHYIIKGSGTLVTGGTMVRPPNAGRGGAGDTVEGGVSRHVAAGDVIFIPAGSPHWYKEIDAPLTYLETRFQEVK